MGACGRLLGCDCFLGHYKCPFSWKPFYYMECYLFARLWKWKWKCSCYSLVLYPKSKYTIIIISAGSRLWDKKGGAVIKGGLVSQKNFFWPLGPQFGLKLRGAPSPGSTTNDNNNNNNNTNNNNNNILIQSIKCILKVTKVIKIKVKLKL